MSVVPHAGMGGEALAMCRLLSSMYADLAAELGAAYIDVEAVIGSASPSGADAGGAEARTELDSADESVVQRRLPASAYVCGPRGDIIHHA